MQIQTLTSCLWIVFGVSWKSCWNWQNQNKRFYYCQLTVSPETILWPHADMIHPINLQFLAKAPNAAIHAGRRIGPGKCLGPQSPVHPQLCAAQLFVSTWQAHQARATAQAKMERKDSQLSKPTRNSFRVLLSISH